MSSTHLFEKTKEKEEHLSNTNVSMKDHNVLIQGTQQSCFQSAFQRNLLDISHTNQTTQWNSTVFNAQRENVDAKEPAIRYGCCSVASQTQFPYVEETGAGETAGYFREESDAYRLENTACGSCTRSDPYNSPETSQDNTGAWGDPYAEWEQYKGGEECNRPSEWERKALAAEKMRARRAAETEEQRHARLVRNAERMRAARSTETIEQRRQRVECPSDQPSNSYPLNKFVQRQDLPPEEVPPQPATMYNHDYYYTDPVVQHAHAVENRTAWNAVEDSNCGERNVGRHEPHMCPVCSKTFRSKSALRIHSKQHGEEKQFTCTDCGKRFTYRKSFIKHTESHSVQQRPYVPTERAPSYMDSFRNSPQHVPVHQQPPLPPAQMLTNPPPMAQKTHTQQQDPWQMEQQQQQPSLSETFSFQAVQNELLGFNTYHEM